MNRVKTVFLMTALAGILMAIGGLIGGRSGVMVMFLIATAMNFISYWFSDTMVLKAIGHRKSEKTTTCTASSPTWLSGRTCPCPRSTSSRPMCPMPLRPDEIRPTQP